MKFFYNFLAGIIILFFITNDCIFSQENESLDIEKYKIQISDYIENLMTKHGVTGLSVSLIDDGKIIWAEGFGYADYNNKIKADENTIYQFGSISKIFTATAVMQLAEKGLIDIDKPVSFYIEEFKPLSRYKNSKPITVRNLMTHHSGLAGDKLANMSTLKPNAETFRDELKYHNSIYTAYPPEYIFSYSNLGADLLGIIVERISGKRFEEYVRENIFLPAGMEKASFYQMSDRKDFRKYISRPYKNLNVEAPDIYIRNVPAGTLNGSVLDLSCFLQTIMANGTYNSNSIIKSETLNEMLTPQNLNVAFDKYGMTIGLNWLLSFPDLDYAGRFCGHGGVTPSFHSLVGILRDHKIGVVVAANTSSADKMVNKIFSEMLKKALELKTGIKPIKKEKQKPQVLSEEQLAQYTGDYAVLSGIGLLKISEHKKDLKIKFMGKRLELVPYGDDWFDLKLNLFFSISIFSVAIKQIEGKTILIANSKFGTGVIGEKIQPYYIPEEWKNRLGKYRLKTENIKDDATFSENNMGKIKLVLSNGYLIAKSSEGYSFVLKPVSDDEALILGLGRGGYETIFIKNENGRDILVHSGLEFEKKK